jgi:hypothetical protein
MVDTRNFRRQHDEILALAASIRGQIRAKNVADANRSLAKLNGLVKMHLATEDDSLYPRLMKSADPAVKKTAQEFHKEMGGLREVYAGFAKKWMPAAVTADPSGFDVEFGKVTSALGDRIKRENEVLYALADKVA